MASELAAVSLLATVTDIRWLLEFKAYHFLKVRADGEALGLAALTAKLAKLKFAGIADIGEMLALPTVPTGVIGIFFYNLIMSPDLFGNGGWIFAHLPGDLFERHSIPETGLNDDAFAKS